MVMYLRLVNIDDKVFIASMPSEEDIEELSKEFSSVVILPENHELEYDVQLWKRYGVEYLHVPIKDFRAPSLIELYTIVSWIVERKGKVLIHCLSGKGRSGTVASAYLMYSYRLPLEEALNRVRNKVSGAVETLEQEAVLEAYELMIKNFSDNQMKTLIDIGRRYDWGRGVKHASRVCQLTLKLWKALRTYLDLSINTIIPLGAAALLHDVGVALEEPHHVHSYTILMQQKELEDAFGSDLHKIIALLAKHHRNKTDPRTDPECKEFDDLITKLVAILRVADGLDYQLDQAVVDVSTVFGSELFLVKAFCIGDCEVSINKARKKAKLLSDVLGKDVVVEYETVYL